jgi:Fe-S-cluster containining protein
MRPSILQVYAVAEEALPERSCTSRACCCQFVQTGREPFVTQAELGLILRELRNQGRALPKARPNGACPLLSKDGKRCTVYPARPLGCRTYFCREAGGPASARSMREAVQLLTTVDEGQGRRGSQTLTTALANQAGQRA